MAFFYFFILRLVAFSVPPPLAEKFADRFLFEIAAVLVANFGWWAALLLAITWLEPVMHFSVIKATDV